MLFPFLLPRAGMALAVPMADTNLLGRAFARDILEQFRFLAAIFAFTHNLPPFRIDRQFWL
jgi:hypothetical protein